MRQRGNVFVFARDGAARDLIAALRTFQWAVTVFDSLALLHDGLQMQVASALVLVGVWPDVAERAAALRREAPAAALVWQACGATPRERIAALNAGVDACAGGGMEALEWDALLRNLCRRGRRAGSSWRIDLQVRALAGPGGQFLPLTEAECVFFVRLLNAPGHRMRRDELRSKGVSSVREGSRRVDVMVSRLRTKAHRLGIEFPVLAVRGWGYMLLPDGR
ncbi:hypothetical protein D9M68_702020 [compost metagenome]|uniref:OmpR/PhoB-type domain-containing protein n=1 Tax=Achromobacter agilis TaxID=1353888 RepID=A0A446C216_9BURK|nr:helix-turn-helix domain-containing protein [Achromobacter agilis]SSW61783.1 hypothetical protein AGI3411_00085 [Achromobacter agilis]